MQTLYYNTDRYIRHNDNIVDLAEYRRRVEAVRQPAAAGLPPRARRQHRCPLGVRLADLVSMSAVAATFIATGMVVAGI